MSEALEAWLVGPAAKCSTFQCAQMVEVDVWNSLLRFSLLYGVAGTAGFTIARFGGRRRVHFLGRELEAHSVFAGFEFCLSLVILILIGAAIQGEELRDDTVGLNRAGANRLTKIEGGSSEGNLLVMTSQHALVLLMVAVSHAFDMGMYFGGVCILSADTILIHHPLTLVGICLMLLTRTGGGAIVRLLLDSITFVLMLFEQTMTALLGSYVYRTATGPFRIHLHTVIDVWYWIAWTALRMIYYPWICFNTLKILLALLTWESGKAAVGAGPYAFTVVFGVWSVYAFADHCSCYYNWMRYDPQFRKWFSFISDCFIRWRRVADTHPIDIKNK